MNKIKLALKNCAILALLISTFVACDKDFATVGSDIIGENNFGVTSTKYPVIAYTNPLEAVQTNNLPLNYLGVYNDPLYGLTTASFVSQLGTSFFNPDFGENVELDSVVMTVPYFSRRVEVNAEGETIYELDSIFGGAPIDLEIFENSYFLNNINPNSEFDSPLTYFSDTSSDNGPINSTLLEGTPILLAPSNVSLSGYLFSNKEIQLKKDGEITERLAPALRLKLKKDFWQTKIIDKEEEGGPELSNANNFNNYFRGIYIKAASPNGTDGSMALLNFGSSAANITLYFTNDPFTAGAARVQSTFVLSFTGNRVNLLSNQFIFTIPQGDPVNGDEKLFLKGAEGSMAVVDIFNAGNTDDGFSTEFNAFKNAFVQTDTDGKFMKSKRLVNEANLVFFVDQAAVQNIQEPNRVFLYDLKNNTPLFDYYIDLADNTSPTLSRPNHLGVLQREGGVSTGDGIKYKIKITEHINNLLMRDSTNVKFGLAVSGNVNLENGIPQYKVLTTDSDLVNKVPVSSILTPRGTVLYGNNTANEQKKLYLEIYYTEPNN